METQIVFSKNTSIYQSHRPIITFCTRYDFAFRTCKIMCIGTTDNMIFLSLAFTYMDNRIRDSDLYEI